MEFRRRAAVLGAVFAVLTGVVGVPAAAAAGIGELHGLVWFDRDGNFRHDPGDPGRAGAKVTAHLASPPTDYVTVTDAQGGYSFTGLPLGDYRIFGNDDGYRSISSNTHDRTLTEQYWSGYDEFAQIGGRLHGRAWDDTNGDGIRQSTEPRRETQISLVGPSAFEGLLNRTVTTTGGEDYYIEDIPQGTYKLRTTPPPGLTATKFHAGTEWYLDSDFHGGLGSTLSTDPISVWPDTYEPNNDVGFVPR
ncbi:SdrD B-like domain-containing protein [Amycolatopsis solani]|uniref:SdrD B-like domain-containing protein n=1 Tax=Amycolatopsis solani TaxID=3028615 RepID=UPI0025AF5F7C|nr:SdrD B-like domain-containing protein [Amycolatopsis sp. MEP2-6]